MRPTLTSHCMPVAAVSAIAIALVSLPAASQETWDGYLCCNYRYDRTWMSDSNYAGNPVMPVGTPVRITGYGRYRVHTEMDGKKISIGNDYSRNLPNDEFARRIVVRKNPKRRIASFAPRVQQAIRSAQVMRGMTKEQVLMAIGYPIMSENPTLDAPVWRYWLGTREPFEVRWSPKGVVERVSGDPAVVSRVVMR